MFSNEDFVEMGDWMIFVKLWNNIWVWSMISRIRPFATFMKWYKLLLLLWFHNLPIKSNHPTNNSLIIWLSWTLQWMINFHIFILIWTFRHIKSNHTIILISNSWRPNKFEPRKLHEPTQLYPRQLWLRLYESIPILVICSLCIMFVIVVCCFILVSNVLRLICVLCLHMV